MRGLRYEVLVLGWIRVRGFGAGLDWGPRFWSWDGLGFEVLGFRDWGSRFWCVFGVSGKG